jgi:hypothetical protein
MATRWLCPDKVGFGILSKKPGVNMKNPKIENRPAFTVAGVKYLGKNENDEISRLWRESFNIPQKFQQMAAPIQFRARAWSRIRNL